MYMLSCCVIMFILTPILFLSCFLAAGESRGNDECSAVNAEKEDQHARPPGVWWSRRSSKNTSIVLRKASEEDGEDVNLFSSGETKNMDRLSDEFSTGSFYL